jgi:hypothetical protein
MKKMNKNKEIPSSGELAGNMYVHADCFCFRPSRPGIAALAQYTLNALQDARPDEADHSAAITEEDNKRENGLRRWK